MEYTVEFVEDKRTDTEVAVAYCAAEQVVVVSLRGTESLTDCFTDGKFIACPYKVRGHAVPNGGKVHAGFAESWNSVEEEVLAKFKRALAIVSVDAATGLPAEPRAIFVTGHSLGGALATLCAIRMAELCPAGSPGVSMYTFGSPRVGTSTFADYFATKVPHSWRIVNKDDIVPRIPPALFNYQHVRHMCFFELRGDTFALQSTTDGDSGDDDDNDDGTSGFQSSPGLSGIRAIRNGSYLRHHGVSQYIKSIQKAMDPNPRVNDNEDDDEEYF